MPAAAAGRRPIPENPQPTPAMSKLTTIKELLIEQIKDLSSAENQLVKALPKMAKAASDPELRQGFEAHLEQTKTHVDRLEQAAEMLGARPGGKTCKAMQGLVEEGAEAIKEDAVPDIKDLALIAAAQRVEHYEIAGYSSALELAEALVMDDVAELLQLTLDEESETDEILSEIASSVIASAEAGGED